MSGKPAARQGDMTQYGGPIVQGSAGVRIGAPTGVACSVCPGGMTSGNPVNPLLGAKVLPGETDLALPGPLPFILSRTYSSYRTRTPAPVGVFGPGWKAPSDIRLQLRDDALVLNDNGGRSIHFEPLLPGERPAPLRYLLLTVPALSQPQRSPTHCPVPNTAPTGVSAFRQCG